MLTGLLIVMFIIFVVIGGFWDHLKGPSKSHVFYEREMAKREETLSEFRKLGKILKWIFLIMILMILYIEFS